MTIKGGSRKHRMRKGGGGDSASRPHGNDVDLGDLHEITDSSGSIQLKLDNQSGGYKHRRHHRHTKKCKHTRMRKSRKSGMSFGLMGLKKIFTRTRRSRRYRR